MAWFCLKSYQKQRFGPTFFDNKNFVTAVSIDEDLSTNVDYYVRWDIPRTNSSAVVDSLKLLPKDPSTRRRNIVPPIMYLQECVAKTSSPQWFPMCQFGFKNHDTQIRVQIQFFLSKPFRVVFKQLSQISTISKPFFRF